MNSYYIDIERDVSDVFDCLNNLSTIIDEKLKTEFINKQELKNGKTNCT